MWHWISKNVVFGQEKLTVYWNQAFNRVTRTYDLCTIKLGINWEVSVWIWCWILKQMWYHDDLLYLQPGSAALFPSSSSCPSSPWVWSAVAGGWASGSAPRCSGLSGLNWRRMDWGSSLCVWSPCGTGSLWQTGTRRAPPLRGRGPINQCSGTLRSPQTWWKGFGSSSTPADDDDADIKINVQAFS